MDPYHRGKWGASSMSEGSGISPWFVWALAGAGVTGTSEAGTGMCRRFSVILCRSNQIVDIFGRSILLTSS